MRTLIYYYSQAVGNTERIANMLQEAIDSDMEKIDTLIPYKGTYQEISEQGHKEVNERYKPKLKPINLNPEMYDRVIILTPTWWYTMAPAIVSCLLNSINLKGKEVILVQTHAGWAGHTLNDMENMCKGAKIISKKDIQFDSSGGTELITPMEEIEEWRVSRILCK